MIGTFLNEGVAMLAEGIDPQTIEQAFARPATRRRCCS